jgi:hypothetical protein
MASSAEPIGSRPLGRRRKRQCFEFVAEWTKYGKAAGPFRNQKMLDVSEPDLVVAFAGGQGTGDMVHRWQASRSWSLAGPARLDATFQIASQRLAGPSGPVVLLTAPVR